MCGLYAHAADPSDSVLSACDGSTELVLHPSQALTQADALAFCRQHHGASAVLPSSASLQAAQSLVQQGQVLSGVAAAPLPAAPFDPFGSLWIACHIGTARPAHLCFPVSHLPQLAAIPGDPILAWSAAAWLAVTQSTSDPSAWVDNGAPATSLPWCPGEPNNRGGSERCTSLLTACSPSGAALVNDVDCSQKLRVVCAVPSSAGCSSPSGRPPAPAVVSPVHAATPYPGLLNLLVIQLQECLKFGQHPLVCAWQTGGVRAKTGGVAVGKCRCLMQPDPAWSWLHF